MGRQGEDFRSTGLLLELEGAKLLVARATQLCERTNNTAHTFFVWGALGLKPAALNARWVL